METKQDGKVNKAKPQTVTTVSLRVKRETKRRLLQELSKINKKDFGKRIKADDLIGLALTLVESHHILALQQASLSNGDRLEMLYRDHVKKHGAISKDEFIGKILFGNLGSSSPVSDTEISLNT